MKKNLATTAAILSLGAQSLFAQTFVNENFAGSTNQDIDFSGTGTAINGVTYHGHNTDKTASEKYPAQVKNEAISVWCQYNTLVGNVTWDNDDTPTNNGNNTQGNPVTNVVIDLTQNTTLYNFASKITRPSGGHWWYRVQYSTDSGANWTLLTDGPKQTGALANITKELSSPIANVDKVRINVWRNGSSDPNEILIDNISINSVKVNVATNVTASGFTANWATNPDADSYSVTLYSDEELTNQIGSEAGISGTSKTIAYNFTEGQAIYYTVTALNGVTPIAKSSVKSVAFFSDTLTARHRYSFTADATDSVGNADLTLSTGSVTGALVSNNSVTADASGDSLKELGIVINSAAVITFEGWYTLEGNQTWSKIFVAGSSGTDFIAHTPKTNSTESNTQINSNATGTVTATSVTPPLSKVIYFAVTYDQNTNKMTYRHASEDDTNITKVELDMGANSPADLTVNMFSIGAKNFWGNPKINGSIDEFRIWTGTFTDSDASTHRGTGPDSAVTPAIGLEVELADNTLTWKVEEERDVKEYQIFVDGKLFDTVTAVGADSYSLEVPGEDVVLKVVDNSGHTKPFIPADGNSVTEVYNLKEGWNLIAITSDNADLEALKGETVGVVWGWNNNSYEVVESAEATDAVWVYSSVAKEVSVTGTKSDTTLKLNIGWNMVGPVVTSDVPEEAHTVYSWDSVYDNITEKYNTLEQGKGYWIFSL